MAASKKNATENKAVIVIPSMTVMFLYIAVPFVLAFVMGTTARKMLMEKSAQQNVVQAPETEQMHQEADTEQALGSAVVLGQDGMPQVAADAFGYSDIMLPLNATGSVSEMKEARSALQESYRGRDEAYYESVVHPALFTHENPKRVAIIGEGEGAILREVLKHDDVEKVTVYALNDIALAIQRKTPSPWNSCGDIEDSALSCYDDPRVTYVYRDSLTQFITVREKTKKDMYDVIFVDTLDPKDKIRDPREKLMFINTSYNHPTFLTALYNSVGKSGIVVTQLGPSPSFVSPAGDILGHMEQTGFLSFHIYDESRARSRFPYATVIACKSLSCRHCLYISAGLMDFHIYYKLRSSVTSAPLLKSFDGATYMKYLTPHKAFQTMFCRQYPKATSCLTLRGYIPEGPVIYSENFDVKVSTIGHGGLGLFTKIDIPKGAAIAPDKSIDPVHFSGPMYDLLTEYKYSDLHGQHVHDYAIWYGYEGCTMTDEEYYVESGIASFANHGCGGSYNIGPLKNLESNVDDAQIEDMNESSSDLDSLVKARKDKSAGFGYNPVNDRHLTSFCNGEDYSLRDIKAGEELFSNYLPYVKDKEEYIHNVKDIRQMCGVKD